MNYRKFALVKIFLLIAALGLAIFLAFDERSSSLTSDQQIVFVLDLNRTMNTQDVLSGTRHISRIAAAKSLIAQTILSEPGFSYGLVIFNAHADYILPPTFDTGTFLLYLSGITTNVLPAGKKDFTALSGMFETSHHTSYIVLSDFDADDADYHFPAHTSLIGIGSSAGGFVKYANGVRYYDNGKSVSSARNDALGRSFHISYTPLASIDTFASHHLLDQGFTLPLSQRILLYTLLGVLVIFAIML